LRDGWLSWPCWLSDSRWLNHKVVTRPASSLVQDRKSSPVETSILTTMLRRQPGALHVLITSPWQFCCYKTSEIIAFKSANTVIMNMFLSYSKCLKCPLPVFVYFLNLFLKSPETFDKFSHIFTGTTCSKEPFVGFSSSGITFR